MVKKGLVNLDFADVRSVMRDMGKAMMGTGEAEGQDRSRVAAESAISNPLLEDHSMKGAKGVLINITGGLDMTLHEVDEEDGVELEPLRAVQGHEGDRGGLAVDLVEVGDERDTFEERLHAIETLGQHDFTAVAARFAETDPADRREPADVATVDLRVELARDADEFLEVLDTAGRFDRTLGFEFGDVAGASKHRFEHLAHSEVGGVGLDLGGEVEEVVDTAECPAGDAGLRRARQAVAEGDLRTVHQTLDLGDRRVADTAFGNVDDALPTHFVVGVHQRAQVRECVLDLLAVVELRSAEHPVRHTRSDERLLHDTTLRVRSVEDRDVAVAVLAAVDELVDFGHDEGRLVVFVLGLVADDGLTVAEFGPQLLGPVRRVVRDHRVRSVEDLLRRAVVLVEHDDGRVGEGLLETRDVAEVGATELVDRLVHVADGHDAAMLLGEHPHQFPLRDVRVLELVDEQVPETAPPPIERVGVLTEQSDREDEHVVEVEGRRVSKAPLVLRVHLRDPLFEGTECSIGVLLREHEFVLQRRDALVQRPRGKTLGVEIEITTDPIDEADGVALVVDRERAAVSEQAALTAQDAGTRRVEGAHPHALGDGPDEFADPSLHLGRGLVGERDRQYLERRDTLFEHEVGEASGEDTGLARAGTGDDEHRRRGDRHCLELGGIEVGVEVVHGSIDGSSSLRPTRTCVRLVRGAGPGQASISTLTVTGPSLTSATCMSARKRPVSTRAPDARSASTTASTSGSATSGGAAATHDGRRPLRVSP